MKPLLAFDADDTLWHDESHYIQVKERYYDILNSFASKEKLSEQLNDMERKNIHIYGYGRKSFSLSMLETALVISQGALTHAQVQDIYDLGKELCQVSVDLFPDVMETLHDLSRDYTLALITKGDLFDQQRKIEASGLKDFFSSIDIVTEKHAQTYADIIEERGWQLPHLVMIGNSLKSDILPTIQLGMQAIHIPFESTWELDYCEVPEHWQGHFHTVESIAQVPEMVRRMTWPQ